MQIAVRTREDIANIKHGVVVTIDVLRAFTTACFLFAHNPRSVELSDDKEYCLDRKKEDSDLVLVGERNGVMIEGYDYNNSPTQVQHTNMQGKEVIFMTTAGTKTMLQISKDMTVFTGSFVNAQATIDQIMVLSPEFVTFVPTSHRYFNNEDFQCAAYMKSLMEKREFPLEEVKEFLHKHPIAEGFVRNPLQPYSKNDFTLCFQENIFDFALKRVIRDGKHYLEKVVIT